MPRQTPLAPGTGHEQALANVLVGALNAREQEGARLSRVLHDEVGQSLSALGLQLDLLRMDLSENPGDCARQIKDIQSLLEQVMAHVRDLSYELNPNVVERAGLQFALDRLASRCRKNFPGQLRLHADPSVHVPSEAATAMYRIAEQALENSMAHARATKIEILLKPSRAGAGIEVRDNGVGFERAQPNDPKGLGLRLMAYQAARAGLSFSVASAPQKGTIVKAVLRGRGPDATAE